MHPVTHHQFPHRPSQRRLSRRCLSRRGVDRRGVVRPELAPRSVVRGFLPLMVAVVGALVLVVAMPTASSAHGIVGGVTCQQNPQPGCDTYAGTPGHPASGTPAGDDTPGTAPPTGPQVCRDPDGQVIACQDPDLGAVGSDGCYYSPASAPADAPHRPGHGGWYWRICTHQTGTAQEGFGTRVWRAAPPAGAAGGATPRLSPQQVAVEAVARLRLPAPAIVTNPAVSAQNLVGVPVWLWIARSVWDARSATAAVPGVRVTATATPTQVSWHTGDGAGLTCSGPGTPWVAGTSPTAASPDCGHTYTSVSADQPDGRFHLTATITWAVTWAGAGSSGTLPALTTTDGVRLRVGESQALNATG